MRVIQSSSSSVYDNLAWEEWWLDRFGTLGPLLLFYVNGPAVVVGKNQNPWRETNPAFLSDEGVDLARRISGGGTVYHDEGNLNYSLILDRHGYRQDDVFQKIISALQGAGIAAEMMPANSIGVAGRKFSGHAFCYRGGAVLHHGTLLIDADLDQLRQAMRPAWPELETRAVASRPASVINLAEVMPGLDAPRLMKILTDAFALGVSCSMSAPPEADEAWQALQARGRDWEWQLGYTPAFTCRLASGERQLKLYVDRGAVQDALLTGPSGEQRCSGLAGCRFAIDELLAALKTEMPCELGLIAELARHSF